MSKEKFDGVVNSTESLTKLVSSEDNSLNLSYISNIPDICKDEPCLLGIDEAGRGPVLGPMVYGIAFCPLSKSELLTTLNCADSKALTEDKRDSIFADICKNSDTVGWAVDVISPNYICNNMLSRTKISLNQVSMDSAIGLIRKAISAGVNLAEIYVDTVGPPEKYQAYLLKLFPDYIITVAKKADSTYPIVSAASICAKVTRDHALKNWRFQENADAGFGDFGSGYPGDPVTKKFLQSQVDSVFGFPQLVRFSWSTSSNILEEKAYSVEWEEVDEENSSNSKNSAITSFFKPFSAGSQNVKMRHKYFAERCLASTSEF